MISFIVIVAVLAICVYDYLASRDWQQMTSASRNEVLFRSRNRRYGAYQMRKSYNRLMATLVIGVCVLTVFSMAANAVYHAGSDFQTRPPQIDTTLLSLNAPPLEPIETLPESVQLAAAPKQKAQEEQRPQKQNNQPQDNAMAADPATSQNSHESETKPVPKKDKSKMTPEERARAFEEETKASMPGNVERERLLREREERKAQRERDAQNKKSDQKTIPVKKPEGGAAVVTFNLEGRTVLKEAEDLPIPAYMCKSGGTVRVKITVFSNGTVIPNAEDSNVDPCLVNEAVKYARKARFVTTSTVQRGWIEYKFHQQ